MPAPAKLILLPVLCELWGCCQFLWLCEIILLQCDQTRLEFFSPPIQSLNFWLFPPPHQSRWAMTSGWCSLQTPHSPPDGSADNFPKTKSNLQIQGDVFSPPFMPLGKLLGEMRRQDGAFCVVPSLLASTSHYISVLLCREMLFYPAGCV